MQLNKYVVIKIKGRQYMVSPQDEFLVDRISEDKIIADILLFKDGDKVKIGKPNLEEVKIKLEKVEDVKGNKIKVLKYKAKSRYRKRIGFTPLFSKLRLESISSVK